MRAVLDSPTMKRASLILALLSASLGGGGCSLTYDSSTPDLPLLGSAPNMAAFTRLNHAPAGASYFVYGRDGNYWLAIQETETDPTWATENCPVGRPCLRVIRMTGQPAETTYSACLQSAYGCPPGYGSGWAIAWRAFYLLTDVDPAGKLPTELTILAAGDRSGEKYSFPPGPPLILSAGADNVFVYWPRSADTKSYFAVHRGAKPTTRMMPVPDGVDPAKPDGAIIAFNGDASILFTRNPKGKVHAWSTIQTDGHCDLDVGMRPAYTQVLSASCDAGGVHGSLRTMGDDGIRQSTFDGKPDLVLEPDEVTPGFVDYEQRPGADMTLTWYGYYYTKLGQLRRVALDGSAPPETILVDGLARLYGIFPDGRLIYTKDPGNRYIYGVGDGWLGDWQFMQRGRDAMVSGDALRMRWIEHSAQTSATGDLLSAPIGGPALRLARNVSQYDELGDGRVLALANRAFPGVQNRIVVVDELTQKSAWVAVASNGYSHIYGSTDLLVDVVTGATGHDLVRVPVPKMACADLPNATQKWLDSETKCKADAECRIVTTACGLPGACGVAGNGVAPNRLQGLVEEWTEQKCAPADCAPCPMGPKRITSCIAGVCVAKPAT